MTSPTTDYPPLTNWQDLERLAVDLFTAIYQRQFQRWGREGQEQEGIDAWALMPNGKAVVVQCKGKSQRLGKRLTTRDVDDALNALGDFKFEIEEIYILTTAPDDEAVHHHATALSAQRLQRGECSVNVWGWGTICDRINLYEQVQKAHFGHWFKRTSIRQWVVLAGVICAISTVAVVFTFSLLADRKLDARTREQWQQDLQQFALSVDALEAEHGKCQQLLLSQPFTFQAEFRRSCTKPISAKLKNIEDQVKKVAPSMASSAWTEINQLSQLMLEDYRQAEFAALVTDSFEHEVIQGMHELCFKDLTDEARKARRESLRQRGREAITEQLHYYFVLHDFIIPGLSAMQSRVSIRSRELANQAIPADLLESANSLTGLLNERKAFHFKAPAQPLTLSVVKAMSSRDIQFSGEDSVDEVEELRWRDLLTMAPSKVFYGKPKEIEVLIKCGVFKPAARELANNLQPFDKKE